MPQQVHRFEIYTDLLNGPTGYRVPENALDLIMIVPMITDYEEWKELATDYTNYPMTLEDNPDYDPSYSFQRSDNYKKVNEIICQYNLVHGLCRFGTEELFCKHTDIIRQVLQKDYLEDPQLNMTRQMQILNKLAQICQMRHKVTSLISLNDLESYFERYIFDL